MAEPASRLQSINRGVPCEDGGEVLFKQCLHKDHEGNQFMPVAYRGKHRAGLTAPQEPWKFCGAEAMRLSRIPNNNRLSPIREVRGDGPLDLTLAVFEDQSDGTASLNSFRFKNAVKPPGSVTIAYNEGPTRQPGSEAKELVRRVIGPALFSFTENTVRMDGGEMANPYQPTKRVSYHAREAEPSEVTAMNTNNSVRVCHCGRIPRPWLTHDRGDDSVYYLNFTLEYGVIASFRELLFVVLTEDAMVGSQPPETNIEAIYWTDKGDTKISFAVHGPHRDGEGLKSCWESSVLETTLLLRHGSAARGLPNRSDGEEVD